MWFKPSCDCAVVQVRPWGRWDMDPPPPRTSTPSTALVWWLAEPSSVCLCGHMWVMLPLSMSLWLTFNIIFCVTSGVYGICNDVYPLSVSLCRCWLRLALPGTFHLLGRSCPKSGEKLRSEGPPRTPPIKPTVVQMNDKYLRVQTTKPCVYSNMFLCSIN